MELLERAPELTQLAAHLREAAAGRGRVVFVAGESGIGKTSLVDAFCRQALGGAEILRASCDALSTPGPLGPLRDVAPALGVRLDRAAADGEGRDWLFRGVLEAFATRPGATVMVGEDAHWADGASIDLFRFVARRIGSLRLLFLVTFRDDELGPTHPLRVALGDLATTPTVHRMHLTPLSSEAVGALAQGSGRSAADLHRLTGGNPFFLTEVLAAGDAGVPTTVEDAVLARAARLSPEARAVLDVAALIGATVDLDLLLAVAGPVQDEVDACIVGGLLQTNGDRLTFRHQLTRDAVAAAISLPRRRLLHARILAALRAVPAEARDPARLAHHADAAGDKAATLEFAVAAAEQAASLQAHREAAAQYARALRDADRLPDAERAALLEARSVASYLSDQGKDAIADRLAAVDLRRRLGDRAAEGENLRWLSRFYWFQGRGAEAEAAGSEALAVLEALPPGPQLAMAYSNLSQLRMLARDDVAAIDWGERAIALAERFDQPETLAHALTNVGSMRLERGEDRGRREIERAVRIARDGGFVDHAARAMTNLAWSAVLGYRHAEADARLAEAIAYATEHDLDLYHGYLSATHTLLRLQRGEWDGLATDLSALMRRPNVSPLTRIVALTVLGRLLARRGEDGAAEALDEALALGEPTGQILRLGPIRAARAEVALLAGDRAGAAAEVRAVGDVAFARGDAWLKGELAWLLRRAGADEAPTADLAAPFALQVAGDWAAAAAAWERLGTPYEAARAVAEGDDPAAIRAAIGTFERLGARPAAAQARRRLQALGVRDLPPVPRGPRRSTQANPAGLTRRELEVLALLVEGRRNAEIADRLYLTPKTVAHHVSAILAKLGVETRAEATRAAAELGIAAA